MSRIPVPSFDAASHSVVMDTRNKEEMQYGRLGMHNSGFQCGAHGHGELQNINSLVEDCVFG